MIVGKTTTIELGIGIPGDGLPRADVRKRSDGETRNPWDPTRWAGGSSSGSAAGVAAGMFLGAVGTDTAGSIRLPAAFCGVTGLKPTYGRVTMRDVIPLAPTLDTVGPLTRSARDAAIMLEVMSDGDAHVTESLGHPLDGLRIGVERANHLGTAIADPALLGCVEDALCALRDAGAALCDVELTNYQEGCDAVMTALSAEGLAQHHAQLKDQWGVLTSASRFVFGAGALVTACDYVMVQRFRRVLRHTLRALFEEVDVIVCPTTLTGALPLRDLDVPTLTAAIRTLYWNLAGSPVISIPIGMSSERTPLGLQVIGRDLDEATILQVADAFQESTDWHRLVPGQLP